jgi:hypothetical protein
MPLYLYSLENILEVKYEQVVAHESSLTDNTIELSRDSLHFLHVYESLL